MRHFGLHSDLFYTFWFYPKMNRTLVDTRPSWTLLSPSVLRKGKDNCKTTFCTIYLVISLMRAKIAGTRIEDRRKTIASKSDRSSGSESMTGQYDQPTDELCVHREVIYTK